MGPGAKIAADHTRGGHSLDFTVADGTVEYLRLSELHLSVPDTAEQIRRTEGGH